MKDLLKRRDAISNAAPNQQSTVMLARCFGGGSGKRIGWKQVKNNPDQWCATLDKDYAQHLSDFFEKNSGELGITFTSRNNHKPTGEETGTVMFTIVTSDPINFAKQCMSLTRKKGHQTPLAAYMAKRLDSDSPPNQGPLTKKSVPPAANYWATQIANETGGSPTEGKY